MKFAVDSAHRDFYKKNLSIEFEGFFSDDQISKLRENIQKILSQRLAAKKEAWEKASSEQLYMVGRDLWRTDEALRKFVAQSKLVDIAADLIEEQVLRLGYDQYLPPVTEHLNKLDADNAYRKLIELQETTLEAASCIQGIYLGIIICLRESSPSLFPAKVGNVTYFDPKAPIDFSLGNGEYLLIVLVRPNAVYTFQPNDPHTHALKRLGLVFGDALTDKINPTLKR